MLIVREETKRGEWKTYIGAERSKHGRVSMDKYDYWNDDDDDE